MIEAGEPGGNGQRVTNTALQKDIQHLTRIVEDSIAETKDWRRNTEARLRELEIWKSSASEHIRTLDKEQDELCGDIRQVKSNSNTWNGLNSILVVIGSTIASVIGYRN